MQRFTRFPNAGSSQSNLRLLHTGENKGDAAHCFRIWGRPLERSVCSRLKRAADWEIHDSLPYGLPFFTQRRMASTSEFTTSPLQTPEVQAELQVVIGVEAYDQLPEDWAALFQARCDADNVVDARRVGMERGARHQPEIRAALRLLVDSVTFESGSAAAVAPVEWDEIQEQEMRGLSSGAGVDIASVRFAAAFTGNHLTSALAARIRAAGQQAYVIDDANSLADAETRLTEIWRNGPTPHLFILTPFDRDAVTDLDARRWNVRRTKALQIPFRVCQLWMQNVIDADLMEDSTVIACSRLGGDLGFSGRGVQSPESLAGLIKAMLIECWMREFRTTPMKVVDIAPETSIDLAVAGILNELAVPSYDMEVCVSGTQRSSVQAFPAPLSNQVNGKRRGRQNYTRRHVGRFRRRSRNHCSDSDGARRTARPEAASAGHRACSERFGCTALSGEEPFAVSASDHGHGYE